MRVNHFNGDPDGCSEHCSGNNTHPDDAPVGFVCEGCGGGGGCYPVCRERQLNRPYELSEGLTGEQELAEYA